MRELGIEFEELMLKFDSQNWDKRIASLSPSRLVPVLWEGTPGISFCTFDTLAILVRLNELFPAHGVWPGDDHARSRARALCAEFHSGYTNLRSAMPMNIRSNLIGNGHSEAALADIQKLETRLINTQREYGLNCSYLFGRFSAADAYFLPVASRMKTYGVQLNDELARYFENLLDSSAMQEWTQAALQETEFVTDDEPYQ